VQVLRIQRHADVKIGFDLEQGRELIIIGGEQIVRWRRSHQYNFEFERYGLRAQTLDGCETQPVGEFFDLNLAGAQRAFETIPTEIVAQQVFRLDDQKAAIGAVQAAGFDHEKVGVQCAKVGFLLDAPEQVGIGRVVLNDDRRALLTTVIDQDIHLILAERQFFEPGDRRQIDLRLARRLLLTAGTEGIGILLDILLNRFQKRYHLRQIGVLFLQVVDQPADDILDDLTINLFHTLARNPLRSAHLFHHLLEFVLEHGAATQQLFALFGRHRLKCSITQRLAVENRDNHDAHRTGLQDKPLPCGAFADLTEQFFTPGVELMQHLIPPRRILIALERARQFCTQMRDHHMHILLQASSTTGWQTQRPRLVRVVKIVDIAPVRRRWATLRQFFDKCLDGGHFADAGRTGGVDVEAAIDHIETEAQCGDRALLTDDAAVTWRRFSRRKGNLRRIERATQPFRRKFCSHAASLLIIPTHRASAPEP